MMDKFNEGSSDDASTGGTDSECETVIKECSKPGALSKGYWWVDALIGLVDKRGNPETCRLKPSALVSCYS
jgi:hypothetical protein